MYDPKIQVYDLTTDRLVREYTLPKDVIKENSFFANIIADVSKDNCNAAYAYIADLGSNALVVYDLLHEDSYRVTHHFFNFDPLCGDYNIGKTLNNCSQFNLTSLSQWHLSHILILQRTVKTSFGHHLTQKLSPVYIISNQLILPQNMRGLLSWRNINFSYRLGHTLF